MAASSSNGDRKRPYRELLGAFEDDECRMVQMKFNNTEDEAYYEQKVKKLSAAARLEEEMKPSELNKIHWDTFIYLFRTMELYQEKHEDQRTTGNPWLKAIEELKEMNYSNMHPLAAFSFIRNNNGFKGSYKRIADEKQSKKARYTLDTKINEIARSMGYCCSHDYKDVFPKLVCEGNEECQIQYTQKYMEVKMAEETKKMCVKHFRKIPPENLIGSSYEEKLNNPWKQEEREICRKCRKWEHRVCSMFNHITDQNLFICNNCFYGPKEVDSVEVLHKNQCSEFIDTAFKNMRGTFRLVEPPQLSCRVLSAVRREDGDKFENLHFLKEVIIKDPYTFKIIGVFEKIHGRDVLIFMMAVHEYSGKDVSQFKRGRVNIEFIDSVNYFSEQKVRTLVYQEILLAYMKYLKETGFHEVHIYSRPPLNNDDYLMNCRPFLQKTPTPEGLENWFDNIVELGKQRGIISVCEKGYKFVSKDTVESICNKLCYSNGFWAERLNQRLQNAAGKFRNSFRKSFEEFDHCLFYIKLSKKATFVEDPDSLKPSVIAASRESFLEKQKEENWLFYSLRHAKYSTMLIITTLKREQDLADEEARRNAERVVEEGDEQEPREPFILV